MDNLNWTTTAPQLADLNIDSTYDLLQSGSNYDKAISKDGDNISEVETKAALSYRDAFRQGDVITALKKACNDIQDLVFKEEKTTFDTVAFWIQKILYSNKELLSFPIEDEQTPDQSYLQNYSDSIGILANSKFIQLDSTLPVFDVTQECYGTPIPYSASIESKISNNTRNIAYDLSNHNTALFRRNLINIAFTQPAVQRNMATDSTIAHGLNLVNDLPTFLTINEALPDFVDTIKSTFNSKRVFQFVQYMSNIGNKTASNLRDIFPFTKQDKDFAIPRTSKPTTDVDQNRNRQVIAPTALRIDVEGLQIDTDILQKQIITNSYNTSKQNSVLSFNRTQNNNVATKTANGPRVERQLNLASDDTSTSSTSGTEIPDQFVKQYKLTKSLYDGGGKTVSNALENNIPNKEVKTTNLQLDGALPSEPTGPVEEAFNNASGAASSGKPASLTGVVELSQKIDPTTWPNIQPPAPAQPDVPGIYRSPINPVKKVVDDLILHEQIDVQDENYTALKKTMDNFEVFFRPENIKRYIANLVPDLNALVKSTVKSFTKYNDGPGAEKNNLSGKSE
jgi:hypothetical protein